MKRIIFLVLALAGSVNAADRVHRITIPAYQEALPDAPGREVFATACLSCHSTRYITMQPAISAAKWEETVKKMVKVYGAPIGDAQVPAVVGYLMATKEGGSAGPWETPAAVMTNPRSGPVMKVSGDHEMRAKDAEVGKALFNKNCISCHGENGLGDGLLGAALMPKPGDLTTRRFSDEAISRTLRNGVRATAMQAWGNLNDDEMRGLATYVQSFSRVRGDKVAVSEAGKVLYAQNCTSCHGATGGADGVAAAIQPCPPANFQLQQPAAKYAAQVIANGIAGTTMPSWKAKLNEEQQKQLAEYVRSLYVGDR